LRTPYQYVHALTSQEQDKADKGVTGSGASRVGVAEIRLARSEGGAF